MAPHLSGAHGDGQERKHSEKKRNNKINNKMETNNKNKFIVVSYALYDVTKGDNGEEMLIERTTDERPFIFISGMGVTLPAFEEKVVDLAKGDEFDFQLDPEQAYGQHYDERVLELDKQILPSTASLMHSTYR